MASTAVCGLYAGFDYDSVIYKGNKPGPKKNEIKKVIEHRLTKRKRLNSKEKNSYETFEDFQLRYASSVKLPKKTRLGYLHKLHSALTENCAYYEDVAHNSYLKKVTNDLEYEIFASAKSIISYRSGMIKNLKEIKTSTEDGILHSSLSKLEEKLKLSNVVVNNNNQRISRKIYNITKESNNEKCDKPIENGLRYHVNANGKKILIRKSQYIHPNVFKPNKPKYSAEGKWNVTKYKLNICSNASKRPSSSNGALIPKDNINKDDIKCSEDVPSTSYIEENEKKALHIMETLESRCSLDDCQEDENLPCSSDFTNETSSCSPNRKTLDCEAEPPHDCMLISPTSTKLSRCSWKMRLYWLDLVKSELISNQKSSFATGYCSSLKNATKTASRLEYDVFKNTNSIDEYHDGIIKATEDIKQSTDKMEMHNSLELSVDTRRRKTSMARQGSLQNNMESRGGLKSLCRSASANLSSRVDFTKTPLKRRFSSLLGATNIEESFGDLEEELDHDELIKDIFGADEDEMDIQEDVPDFQKSSNISNSKYSKSNPKKSNDNQRFERNDRIKLDNKLIKNKNSGEMETANNNFNRDKENQEQSSMNLSVEGLSTEELISEIFGSEEIKEEKVKKVTEDVVDLTLNESDDDDIIFIKEYNVK